MASSDPFKALKRISRNNDMDAGRQVNTSNNPRINQNSTYNNNPGYQQNFYNLQKPINRPLANLGQKKPGPQIDSFTLKPNIKKAFLRNFIDLLTYTILVIILLLILNQAVGLDVFMIPLDAFGLDLSIDTILTYAAVSIFLICFVVFVVSAFIGLKIKYVFEKDKLVAYETAYFMFIDKKEIPYGKLLKVVYHNKGIYNRLMKSGSIVIETGGGEGKIFNIEFVDDVSTKIQYLNSLLQLKTINQS